MMHVPEGRKGTAPTCYQGLSRRRRPLRGKLPRVKLESESDDSRYIIGAYILYIYIETSKVERGLAEITTFFAITCLMYGFRVVGNLLTCGELGTETNIGLLLAVGSSAELSPICARSLTRILLRLVAWIFVLNFPPISRRGQAKLY